MCRKIFLFGLLTMLFAKLTLSQAPVSYIPQTPMAAQYEKYINYPVDHSTGAASITVPLYSIKASGVNVPVNLSYHTAGVKPSDPCLPVGIGWVINPGARVTRKILGYPDENVPKPPVLKTAEEISPTLEADIRYLQNLEYYGSSVNSSSQSYQYDSDYDVFTYSTGTGITGKFIVQKQGNDLVPVPIIATRDRIKLYSAVSGGLDYFEITDPNGVTYRFGSALTSYSIGGTIIEVGNYTGISGWMLTDIISADKADTINFKWTNVRNDIGTMYKQQGIVDQVIITDNLTGINPTHWGGGDPGFSNTPQYSSGLTESYYTSSVVAGIRYKGEEVKFIYTQGVPTKLETLEVYSNNVKFRQVDFHKSVFTGTAYLKLDSVSIRDKNDQIAQRYRFGYNETWAFPMWPHRRLDFWGYYNGQDNNSLMPNFTYQIFPYLSQPYINSFSTASRGASEDYAQTYILNRVTYPTGGKTTYEYESNKFKGIGGNPPTPAGGLRVKKINHWTVDGQLAETRSYQYGTDGGGDGSPMEASWYARSFWISAGESVQNPADPNDLGQWYPQIYRKRILSSEANETIFIYEYPAVTYRTVTEYIGDASGSNSGKTVYNYSLAQPLPLHSFMYTQDAYGYWGRYWDNPRLEKTTHYKNNQGTYIPVRYSTTTYNTPSIDTIKSIIVRRYVHFQSPTGNHQHEELNFTQYLPGVPSIFLYGTVYFNYGGPAPAFTRNVEFSPSGDSIVTMQTYDYANNDFRYLKSLTSQNSNGATTTTRFTYSRDYNVGTSPTNAVAQGIKLLQDRNVVAPIIEEYTEVQPGNIIKSGKFTTYKTDKPVPEDLYSLNIVSPAGGFSPATITSSSHTKSSAYLLKNKFDLYDPLGNIRQVTDQTTGITTVMLYSYRGKLPIAIIKNTTYAAVAALIAGGDATINTFALGNPANDAAVTSFLSPLRSSLSQAYITSYTHDPAFGMTSLTDENGRTTYYQYDAAGRLQLIKDKDGHVVKTFEYKYKQ